jgi:hypothetical protein
MKIVMEMKISTIKMEGSHNLPRTQSRLRNHRPSDPEMMGAAHHLHHKPKNRQTTIPIIEVEI